MNGLNFTAQPYMVVFFCLVFVLASVSFCKTLKRGIVGVSDGAKHFI